MSPEIGALIGAIVVWTFFWGAGRTFGEADTTLNWLDVAGPTGIMATAVALLMIGGEFDLSAGVLTGGSAIMIGLTATYFKGDGINIGWAILAAFLVAGAVGWFNGFLVNKTGLPSFIVTLASFYVIRGINLIMAQRLAKKVQVSGIEEQEGATFFKKWVAHEWRFTEFAARDKIFVTLVIVGAALFIFALLEQSFVRRSSMSMPDVGVAVAGVIATLIGFSGLLRQDGVSKNAIFSAIGAAGVVLTVVGVARARWMPRHNDGNHGLPAAALRRLMFGAGGVALACLTPLVLDRKDAQPALTWTPSWLRPVFAITAAAIGFAIATKAIAPALRGKWKPSSPIKIALFGLYSGLLLMVGVLAFLQLTTVQGLRAIVMVLLATVGIVMMLSARGLAGVTSRRSQLLFGVLAAVGVFILALVVRADAGAVRFRTGMFSALVLGAVAILANTSVEYFMAKRTEADPAADKLGKRLLVTGAVLAIVGLVMRLVWTNLTPEHAAEVKAAGGSVGQIVLRQSVLWWLLIAAIGAFVLLKTKWGSWIFAVGGNKDAARAVGVPADKVKVGLFVTVSMCGCLAGTLIALRYGTVQANQGIGAELEYIIAAVVGGCLMTGGYGSVIGASLGAAIMAMSEQGVQTTGWDSNGRYVFLGGVLLIAVLVNNFTRKKAQEAR